MTQAFSECEEVRSSFSGYLDGAISGREMQAVARHLEDCRECGREFAEWRGMQRVLEQAATVKAPMDLGLQLRLAISHESARRQGHWYDGLVMKWDNLVRPMVVQVSAGLASTLVLIGSLGMLVSVVAAPEAVLAHDEPLGQLTVPHYLYSAAGSEAVTAGSDTTIVVQAEVNSAGRVYDYTILTGATDPATAAQIRDELMMQVYEPARVFGEPVRGRVLVTFSGVSVRG